jgi:hypothetical protein
LGALPFRRPRPRYLVGFDARSMAAAQRMVPTELKGRLVRRTLGL